MPRSGSFPALGGFCPYFRIPLLTLHTLKFFPTSPPPFYAYGEAVDIYPHRHPYTKTYYVTPTLSSTFHKVSSLNYLTLFFTKRFQIFFGPFPGAPGAHDTHFRIPLLTLHTLKFFPTSPPPFYAYTEAVAPNLQRYPYISIISLTSTQG